MSLRGRYIIDRVKQAVSGYLLLPVPPYGEPNYWEHSYKTLGPYDVNEWARLTLSDLKKYRYKPVPLSSDHSNLLGKSYRPNPDTSKEGKGGKILTSFGETIRVHPEAGQDEPILIAGCGNSKLGEDMVEAKWQGPIIQVDVSGRLCDSMSIRCAPHLPNGNMQIVQDDATRLSAIAEGKVRAYIDKGLLDALFCADEYDQVIDCMRAAHRILAPGGTMITLSFSRPEFFLTRLLQRHDGYRLNIPWENVEIRLLDRIYLYRFTKRSSAERNMPNFAPHRGRRR